MTISHSMSATSTISSGICCGGTSARLYRAARRRLMESLGIWLGRGGARATFRIGGNRHGMYCVPLNCRHRPAVRAVLAGQVWEAATIDLLRGLARDGDVVHAGTFFGDFLPPVSEALGSAGTLWAFEPNPDSFRCAQATVVINGLENVVLTPAGLGSRQGQAGMRCADANGRPLGGESHLLTVPADHASRDGFTTVATVTIDDTVPVERRVAVVQLDVEGFEEPALEGGLRTISRCRPVIVLETPPSRPWFDRHLAPLGYRIEQRIDDNVVLRAA
jgi:FkbM family methyltransferase